MKTTKLLTPVFVSLLLTIFHTPLFADDDDDDDDNICTNETFKGQWAFYQVGEVFGQGPGADIGVIRADGQGNFTGSETVHVGDQIFQIRFDNGTYQVNPDCTGTAEWEAVIIPDEFPIGTRTVSFSIAKKTKEIYLLSTVPGAVLVGTGKQ